ncbi:unnamed protein product [Closterium sp. Naga37s-1]|nr:unnamed protein product [Closterium sp. Naga37s-1]
MMETAAAIPSESRNATSCTGYSWKKYGHKVLASVNVKRFYYACAQKDTHGCPAKKIVDKPRKRPRAGSLNGRAASSGGGSDGGGGGDGGCAGGGALSPEASTTSDNRKPVSPNAAGRLNLLASVSRNDKLSGSSPQDFWARSSFPGPAGAVACAGHDQGSAGEAMAAAAGSDSAAGGELSTETAMKEKTWFENAHNHPPPLLSSRLSRNRFLAAASATAAAAAAAVPPPSPPPQGGVMMAPAASAAGGGVWRQQEQQQQIMLHQQQQQQQQFLVQQQTPKLRTGRNGGQAEPHLATFPAPGNNTQALSVRSPPPHQQAQLQSQQQQLMMAPAMRPAMYAVPSAHANLAPTAERSTVGGNSESNGTTGLCLSSNVCDGSTWEQPSHPGKRLKRDPGSSASLITALGSRLPMPSNVPTHSNSNAPAPALAPALALATAIAAAAAAAAAPAPAARDKATTPAEAQPMERNFIDALSLSPSSLSLACSLAPPHGPKGESHTGEGAKAGGFVGKVRMGKNVKGESLMGEVVLGEGCSPSARGPSLDLPGFYEPSFPELSLSLGRL